MKKNQNRIDKFFNDKLQGKNFEASNNDWNEVEGMLNERDRTGFFLNLFNKRFYMLLAILGLIAVSSLFYFSNNDNGKINSKTELVNENENYEKAKEVKESNDLMSKQNTPDPTNTNTMSTGNEISQTNSIQANGLTFDLDNETQERTDNIVNKSDEILARVQGNNVNSSKINSTENEMVNNDLNGASLDNAKNKNVNGTEQRTAPANGSLVNDVEQNSKKEFADNPNEASSNKANTDPELEYSQPELKLDDQNEVVDKPFNDLGSGSTLDAPKEISNVDRNENASANPPKPSDTSGNKGAENLRTSEENTPGNLIENDPPYTETTSSDKPSGSNTDEPNGNRITDRMEDAIKDSSIADTKTDSIIKSSSPGGVSIGLTLASAFVSKNMKANGAMNDEYFQRRENEESNTVNFHAGINATFHFNHLLLSTGLDYATYSEKVDYLPTSKFLMMDSTFVLDSTPTGGNFFDTIWTVNIIAVDSLNLSIAAKNGRTSWKYLEVPVMIWYRMDKGSFMIDAGAGGSVGILQKVNSYYLNTEITNIENINSTGNYRDVVYNMMLAARVSYKIDANWLIGLDLRYKQNLTSIFKNDYPVEQRYRSINTGVSLMYRLNGKK